MTVLEVRTRDVNFVFFQKSIIVLKKSIFFRLSNLDVAISLCRGLLCNAPCASVVTSAVGLVCRSLISAHRELHYATASCLARRNTSPLRRTVADIVRGEETTHVVSGVAGVGARLPQFACRR